MSRAASVLLVLIATCSVLHFAKAILIPFVVAVIVWYLIREVNRWISLIKFRGRSIPRGLRGVSAFIAIFGTLWFSIVLLSNNLKGVKKVLPDYETNLLRLKVVVEERFGIDLLDQLQQLGADIDLASMFSKLFNELTLLFGNAFLVIIYVAFLMLEEQWFPAKLKGIGTSESATRNAAILKKIDVSLSKYVTLKTFVSLITGVASYIALMLLQVDFAFFWAFLIFLLNYIPTIGSLIGTVFPALVAALQFGALMPAVWVLVTVGVIQVIVGNVVEPKLMGNTLNISSLVVILSLAAWGSLWDIVGMILAVPITVMMILIFAQFPATRPFAVLLSEKGKLT